MIANRKKFFTGAGMMVGFLAVLVAMFLPLYERQSVLNHLDDLFNSISKGSAYYVPELMPKAAGLKGQEFSGSLKIKSEDLAGQAAVLLNGSGVRATVDESKVQVTGDLGSLLTRCVEDADLLYANDGAALEERYGIEGRKALFCWWNVLGSLEKELQAQKMFAAANVVSAATKKGVECAYNYYGIEPQNILDRVWIVVLSLLFYVVYTVWYGFAIMYMFEGLGLNLSH